MTGIVGIAPGRDRRRAIAFQSSLTHQYADYCLDHRLAHREAEQLRIDADAIRIALGNNAPVLDDDDRPRMPGWRVRWFGEGAIERRGKLRALRRYHRGIGDLWQRGGRRLLGLHRSIDQLLA